MVTRLINMEDTITVRATDGHPEGRPGFLLLAARHRNLGSGGAGKKLPLEGQNERRDPTL